LAADDVRNRFGRGAVPDSDGALTATRARSRPAASARAGGFSLHAGIDNLTRFHGVFAPHSKRRAAVTPAHRGLGAPQLLPAADVAKPPTPRQVAMSWARRLKRVFGIEIEGCARCGGKLEVIASIEEPQVIAKILAHLEKTAPAQPQPELARGRRRRRPACFECAGEGVWSLTGRAVGQGRCVLGLRRTAREGIRLPARPLN